MKTFIGIIILIIAVASFGVQADRKCPPISQRKPVSNVWNQERVNPNGHYFPLIDDKGGDFLEKALNVSREYYLQLACPRSIQEDGLHKLTAFDEVASFKCVPDAQDKFKNVTNPWHSNCTHADANPDGNVTQFTEWVVKTDHKTYGLSLRCVDEKLYTWVVFSTRPILTDDVLKPILLELKNNGFNETDVLPIHYGFCEKCSCKNPK